MNEKARERATAALIELGWEPMAAPQGYGGWARGQVWGRDAERRYVIRIFGGRGWSTWRGEVELAGGGGYMLPFEAGEIPRPDEVLDIAEAAVVDAQDRFCNDVYRARGRGELERLVEAGNLSPEVLAGLERDQRYGIAWYNRTRWERTPDGEKAIRVTPNEKRDWIAVPVPDAGVPREWVDAARAATKDNVRSSCADQRSWELKGILFCPCGCRMGPYNSRRGGKRYHYYACGRYRREGPAACEHRKNWPADSLEGAARRYVLALLRDPEVLRRQVRQSLEDEIAALRNPESKIRAWAGRLAEVDRVRLAYQRQQAEGLMTLEELRAHLRNLDERRAEAERELDALRDVRRRVDELRTYSDLVDGYLRELPHLLHGRDEVVREHTQTEEREEREREARAEDRLPLYALSPKMFRERTPEEVEGLGLGRERERAERYRAMYTNLGLRIVAHKDGALELTWRAGEDVSQICASPW